MIAPGGFDQVGIEAAGGFPIVAGAVGLAEGLEGERAIEIGGGRIRRQRDAGRERGDGLGIPPQLEGGESPGEVRPEATRLQVQGQVALGQGGGKTAGPEERPREQVVFPRGAYGESRGAIGRVLRPFVVAQGEGLFLDGPGQRGRGTQVPLRAL